jgi:hypothetical protein
LNFCIANPTSGTYSMTWSGHFVENAWIKPGSVPSIKYL